MSDETPAPKNEEPEAVAAPEPVNAPDAASPAAAPDVEVVPAGAEPVPVTADPAVGATAPAAPATAPTTPLEQQQQHRVVYVETPTPPRTRGKRVVGVLLALVGAIVFAVIYAAIAGLIIFLNPPKGAASRHGLYGGDWGDFMASGVFWVPVLVFALAFILLVVIVNRGGWAAHIFGSLLLAFVVYFASVGLILLVANTFQGMSSTFGDIAFYSPMIAVPIIAREVAIWLGLAISRRGRAVRARNVEARERYEQELAESRARYERPEGAPAPAGSVSAS